MEWYWWVIIIIAVIYLLWGLDALIEYIAEHEPLTIMIIRGVILGISLIFFIMFITTPEEEQNFHWSLYAFLIAQVFYFHFIFSGIVDIDNTFDTKEIEGGWDAFAEKLKFTVKDGVGGIYWFSFIIRLGYSILGTALAILIGAIPVWIFGDTLLVNVIGTIIMFGIEGFLCYTGFDV